MLGILIRLTLSALLSLLSLVWAAVKLFEGEHIAAGMILVGLVTLAVAIGPDPKDITLLDRYREQARQESEGEKKAERPMRDPKANYVPGWAVLLTLFVMGLWIWWKATSM